MYFAGGLSCRADRFSRLGAVRFNSLFTANGFVHTWNRLTQNNDSQKVDRHGHSKQQSPHPEEMLGD